MRTNSKQKLPKSVAVTSLNDRIYQSVKWSLIIGE